MERGGAGGAVLRAMNRKNGEKIEGGEKNRTGLTDSSIGTQLSLGGGGVEVDWYGRRQ